jgi:thiol-disulfide isomerase/thioredoxin
MLNYEVLYQGRIVSRQKTARIKPLGNMIPPPQNKLSEDIRISINTNEYYTGTFQVGNEKYTLRIAEAFSQPFNSNPNDLSIYPYGRFRDTTFNSIDAEFGQPVKVGNTYIRFDSVDFIAQTLYAERLHDYKPLIKTAPALTGQDIVSGRTLEIPSKDNAYTVLFFWGTWCGPCKRDHPALKQLFAEYADKGIRFIGVATDKSPEHVANYIEKNKLPWPNIFVQRADALANTEPITNNYEIDGYPTYFLIDPQGFIVTRGKLGDIKVELGNLKQE